MLFSDIPFLYYFFPCTLLLYFLSPSPIKNTVLLLCSLIFYGWGEPKYLLLMVLSILLGYGYGLAIDLFQKRGKPNLARLFLILSVVTGIGLLGYFKYTDFFLSNLSALTGWKLPLLKLTLPIGISFYTFQILSYTIDVYRGEVAAQKNLITLAAYVSLFPQLIAGPIVRYADVEAQLSSRTHSFENTALGLRRFVLGLGKKILIANALGELCSIFRDSGEKSVLFYWIYAIAFTLHIYFDFSGYSDMAIGLGKIFGFDFPENFNFPYISKSITEFWRRWHMTLGGWFRDYVYIPLGGSRVAPARRFFNIFVVWMLTGLWHGAAWNFIVWGVFYAVLLIIEKLGLLQLLQKSRVLSHVYTMFFVILGFVIFNAADMTEAVSDLGCMFGMGNLPLVTEETLYYLGSYAVVLLLGIIGATPFFSRGVKRLAATSVGERICNTAEPVVLVVLLLVMTGYLVDGSFNPFLYFRF